MTQQIDAVARDIKAKVEALSGSLSDQQRAQVKHLIEDTVDASVAAALTDDKYRPAPGDGQLEGTRYARLGLSDIDVQLAHGILANAKRNGLSERGPSDELTNIVSAIHERAAADDGVPTRAMDTADTPAVVGTQYMTQLWRTAMQDAIVAPLIRSFPMASRQALIPVFGAPPVPVAYEEATTDDTADYETQDVPFARVSVDAHKFGLHQKWSGEIEEESIVPFVQAIRERQQQSLSFYTDDMIVNGDTTRAATGNVNSDDAQLPSNDRRVKFDGIRKGAIVDNSANTVAIAGANIAYSDITNLRALCIDRSRLVAWGHPGNPRDFIYLVNPEGYDTVANLTELLTVDKYGPNATVMTGEVGAIGRNPLLVTMAVPTTEADGKVSATPANNTHDQIVAFNRNALSVGYLRRLTVETYRRAYRDQNGIILFWRMGLARYTPTGTSSGIEWAAVLRDW